MPRSVNAVSAKKRRKKLLNQAKGFYGARSKLYTVAKNAVEKAFSYSYIGRKQKKRHLRQGWIIRINAAVRTFGLNYSKFVNILNNNNIKLNRKTISSLIMDDIDSFKQLYLNL
ncbi:50S ribosomal protein L20 [Candidatus Karelsulcia muelleri]